MEIEKWEKPLLIIELIEATENGADAGADGGICEIS